LAMSKGYYKNEGIRPQFSYPREETMSAHDEVTKAGEKLLKKEVDMCILPASSIIYYNACRAKGQSQCLVGVATISQKDFIGVGVLPDKCHITRPKELDNKIYGSSGLKFSEELVKEMIKADGGKGELKNVITPAIGDIYPGLKEGKFEAACVAAPVHEIKAKRDNMQMKIFYPQDYNVPHPYSAVFCVLKETLDSVEAKEMIRKFLRCAKRGYEDLYKTDSEEVARMLRDQVDHPNMKDSDFVRDSLERAKDFIMADRSGGGGGEKGGKWGCMDLEKIKRFVHFLSEKKILKDDEGKPIGKDIDIRQWFCTELCDQN